MRTRSGAVVARPHTSPPRRNPLDTGAGAGTSATAQQEPLSAPQQEPRPQCLICLDGEAVPRRACGHPYCAECWQQYIEVRISERAVLDIPCPAGMVTDHSEQCAMVTRSEVAETVSARKLGRYDAFVVAERAERDPETRWCTRPGCASVCLPCKQEPLVSVGSMAACGVTSVAVSALPLLSTSVCTTVGLTPWTAAGTITVGTLGFFVAYWHGHSRLGPHRR